MLREDIAGGLGIESIIPEWMSQHIEILNERAKWDDFSFEDRTCRGWLLPYLIQIDAMFSGRWLYWVETLERGKMIEDRPIPQIDFNMTGNGEAVGNLQQCLQKFIHLDVRLSNFLDWILWGLGEGEERPQLDPVVNEFWYKTFNLGLLLRDPYDYVGEILTESKSGYWNNPKAFYPTPHVVCKAMVDMQFSGDEDFREKPVLDPCVGTGRMLMFASNFSLRLFGQDIDRVCVQACKINGYLYMPWLVKPGNIFPPPESAVAHGNSLEVKPANHKRVELQGPPKQLLLFN